MAKEPKTISVVSIPLLHVEPWQKDDILKRMELGRKMYNSALSVAIKKMHVMERTKRWRENEQRSSTIYEKYREMAEQDKASGKYSKDELKARKEAAEKERKKELKECFDEKNAILMEYGFSEFGINGMLVGKNAKINFSPANISTNMASLSIAKPLWAAFSNRYFPKKLSKDGELPVPSFKKASERISLMSNGKSGMRLKEEDGKLWLILSNARQTKRVVKIPINYSDLNVYEKEALSNPIKILTLQAEDIGKKTVFKLGVSYAGLAPIKYTKDGELKHVFNKKGKVGIAIWKDTVCAVSDNEVYIESLEIPEHDVYEEKKKSLHQQMDALKRLHNPDNFEDDGTIKKGIISPNGKRERLKWTFSNHYKDLAIQVKELYRKERVKKELRHWIIVNHILEMGNEFYVAETEFITQKEEFDEDNRKTNEEYRKKKKKRKAIMAAAPYSFLTKLNNKAVANFGTGINKINIPESEYWYSHEYNTSREEALSNLYIKVEGQTILQTAYRAFLITRRNKNKYDLSACQKDFDAFVKNYKKC